jgi:hypothetical protein
MVVMIAEAKSYAAYMLVRENFIPTISDVALRSVGRIF